MQYQTITYKDHDHVLKGAFYANKGAPLLILFPAFEGPSEFCHDYALRFHQLGYQVFIADIYGNACVAKDLDSCFALVTPFLNSRSSVRERSLKAFETVLSLDGVDPLKIGVFGFCFGGLCALELVRSGACVKAAASIHGLLKASSLPTHPIKSELLILHGFLDPQVPPADFFAFTDEMTRVKHSHWQFVFFGDAKHSFTDPKTGTFDPLKEKEMGRAYNKKAAERSFVSLKNFFEETLL
jgi:dienelactone hydrolase